ncbi:MAG: hypothetical protein JNN27_10395 [Planctomycetes bacterium]|nr:hypothetical protein [Planctomycetota bacterium]
MKRLLMLGGLVLLAAAGALWWATRPAPEDGPQTPAPANTETKAAAAQDRSANGAALSPPEEQAGSGRTETPKADAAAAGSQGERAALSLAQLLDYRRLAAEMAKQYAGDESNSQEVAWPVDSDSLLAKYAALDKAGVAKVLADIHGLIEWQSHGPFEDKQAEVLPYRIMLALETERDWLQVRLGEL